MDRNRLSRAIGLIAAVLLAAMLLLPGAGMAAGTGKMPSFSEKDVMDGSEVASEALKGKVLLVNFWATWCPPCRKEIPYLINIQEEYRDKGFSVIGISMDEGGKRVVRKFLEKLKVNYPVILGDAKIGRGFGGVIGIPVTFVVDRDGNLVKRYDGYVSEKELEAEIKKLLP